MTTTAVERALLVRQWERVSGVPGCVLDCRTAILEAGRSPASEVWVIMDHRVRSRLGDHGPSRA
jgi:hypothetical protein